MRPQNLNEFIGCDDIKKSIEVALVSSVERNNPFPHTLIYGAPGLGKTSLSNVIANERNVPFKEYLSNIFSGKEDIRNLLSEFNADGYDEDGKIIDKISPTIVFLDEIHQLNKKTQESLFQAMEDYQFTWEERDVLSGKFKKVVFWVPKFTLIGATTKPGLLDKAFLERFKLILTLKLYNEEEIVIILKNYLDKIRFNYNLSALFLIAKRSRGIARKAINFTERCIDTATYLKRNSLEDSIIEETFKILNINDDGLELLDMEVLNYLYSIYPQKIGISRLASIVNITDTAYTDIIEPYLIRMRLIHITPSGRVISEKGMEYIDKNKLVSSVKQKDKIRRITNG